MQISLRALNWTTDWACKSGLLQCRCSAFFFDLSELSVLESVHELWFFFSLFVLSVSKNFWACWRLVCVCVIFVVFLCARSTTNIHPVARGYNFDSKTALNGMLSKEKKLDHTDTVQEVRWIFPSERKKIGISIMRQTKNRPFFPSYPIYSSVKLQLFSGYTFFSPTILKLRVLMLGFVKANVFFSL